MNAHGGTTNDRWSHLKHQELIALGQTIVKRRLEELGCTMKAANSRAGSDLEVATGSGRSIEVFVSTQRLGGYVFWTKRRLVPASNRLVAIVLLADASDPDVYLLPSTEWRRASPPLTDRDNLGTRSDSEYGLSLARSSLLVGKRSQPEYGLSLARSSLPALRRYTWDERAGNEHFR